MSAHNTVQFGALGWDSYPTLRALMEMCITSQVLFLEYVCSNFSFYGAPITLLVCAPPKILPIFKFCSPTSHTIIIITPRRGGGRRPLFLTFLLLKVLGSVPDNINEPSALLIVIFDAPEK